MKKIYKKPQMEEVKIQTSQMLASSPGYGGTTNETGGNYARGYYWDDENND